jgi:hypothetical protein
MISQKDLEEKYAGYSNEELLDVLRNKEGYTALAAELAQEELSRRKVTNEEITVIEEEHKKNVEHFLVNYARVEMDFVQKCFFYFIWIPLVHFVVKQRLREDGYLLKAKQAGYYSVMGFLFFMLAVVALTSWPEIIGLLTWPIGLLVAVCLEKSFVKRNF